MQKRYITPGEYQSDLWRLAAAVRRSGWRPDVLIALWRGGAPAGIAVHEFFRATGWEVRHVPLKAESYTGIGENPGEVVFTHGEAVFADIRPGDRVLVVDDVFDTGKTAAAVRNRLEAAGAEMRLATVYRKGETGTPDWFVRDFGGEWLVFPHEIAGLTREEVAAKDSALAALLEEFASP